MAVLGFLIQEYAIPLQITGKLLGSSVPGDVTTTLNTWLS